MRIRSCFLLMIFLLTSNPGLAQTDSLSAKSAAEILHLIRREKLDVVLPGALFYETTGSYVSIDGTLETASRANEPRGECQEDWRILESLAARLGSPYGYESAQQIFQELLGTWGPPTRFRFEAWRSSAPS